MLSRLDYLPHSWYNYVVFYTPLISVGIAQYEILCAKDVNLGKGGLSKYTNLN